MLLVTRCGGKKRENRDVSDRVADSFFLGEQVGTPKQKDD